MKSKVRELPKCIYHDEHGYYIKVSVNNKLFGTRVNQLRQPFGEDLKKAIDYLPYFKAVKFIASRDAMNTKSVSAIRKIKFSELYCAWHNNKLPDYNIASSITLDQLYRKHIVKNIEDKYLDEFTQLDFDTWRDKINRLHVYVPEKNRLLNALIDIFKYAEIYCDIKISFAARLRPFNNKSTLGKGKKNECRRYVPIDEFTKFIEALPSDDYSLKYFFIIMYFGIGTRVGEQVALKIENIKENGITISHHNEYCGTGKIEELESTKNNLDVTLPLPQTVLQELNYYLSNYHQAPNDKKAYVFYMKNNPKNPLKPTYINTHRREACKIIGSVPAFDNHSLRHSFITNMSVSCNNPKVTQFYGRHKNLSTTGLYDHSGDLLKDSAAVKLSEDYGDILTTFRKEKK